jgi:TPR repeat protein
LVVAQVTAAALVRAQSTETSPAPVTAAPARPTDISAEEKTALRDAQALEKAGKYAEALDVYRALAEKGSARAQFQIGQLYRSGKGVPHDDAEALRWFRRAAEQGESHAEANVGAMYAFGLGVSPNDVEAVKWLRRGADQGNAGAQYLLGNMYKDGRGGLPKDNEQALGWYRASAAQGNAGAELNIGVMYEKGLGVPKDLAEAVKWYRKAADRGYAEAQRFLGDMYAGGMGVSKDSAEATRWYKKAADQGDAQASQRLASVQAGASPQTTPTTPSSESSEPTFAAILGGKVTPRPTPSVEDLARFARRLPDFYPIQLGLAATQVDNQMVQVRFLQAHPEKMMTIFFGTERVDRNNMDAVAARLEQERGLVAAEIEKRGARDVAGEYDVRPAVQNACDLSSWITRNYKPSQPLGPILVTQQGHSITFGGQTPLVGNGVMVDRYIVLRTGEPDGTTPVRMIVMENSDGLHLTMAREEGGDPCGVGLLVRKTAPPAP